MGVIRTVWTRPFLSGAAAFVVGSIMISLSKLAGYNYFYFMFAAALSLSGAAVFCAGLWVHIFRFLLKVRRQ